MGDWRKKFPHAVEFHAGDSDAALAAIPAKRGVILLTADDDAPILLLPASDLRARVRNRLRNPDEEERRRLPNLQEILRRAYWVPAGGHFETDLEYFELARAIWPKTYPSLLAWKPAWFCHVDVGGECPRLTPTRDVFAGSGQWFGPLPDGRAAGRFVCLLNDAFDLCRLPQCLRKAPHGERCAYAQMNRCRSVCDGTISMDEYRRIVAQAAEFASGRRQPWREELSRRMKEAAEAMQFERAGALKTRLERLDEFDCPAFEYVAPGERFQFLFVQPSATRRAKVFCVDRGAIPPPLGLDWPLRERQVESVLKKMAALSGAAREASREDLWRMGLASRYLYGAPSQRGLVLRYSLAMTAGEFAEAVEAGQALLRLKDPKPRGRKKPPPEAPKTV